MVDKTHWKGENKVIVIHYENKDRSPREHAERSFWKLKYIDMAIKYVVDTAIVCMIMTINVPYQPSWDNL
jgi:hypothetical protein